MKLRTKRVLSIVLAVFMLLLPLQAGAYVYNADGDSVVCEGCGSSFNKSSAFADISVCELCLKHNCESFHCAGCGTCNDDIQPCSDFFEVSCDSECGQCCLAKWEEYADVLGCSATTCTMCTNTQEYADHICPDHIRCGFICAAQAGTDIESYICEYCSKCLCAHKAEDFCPYCGKCLEAHGGAVCKENPLYCTNCSETHEADFFCPGCGKCENYHIPSTPAVKCDVHDYDCECTVCPVHNMCVYSSTHADSYSCIATASAKGGRGCTALCAQTSGCEYCDCGTCLNIEHFCTDIPEEYNADTYCTIDLSLLFSYGITQTNGEFLTADDFARSVPVYLFNPAEKAWSYYSDTDAYGNLKLFIDISGLSEDALSGWMLAVGDPEDGARSGNAGLFRFSKNSVYLSALKADSTGEPIKVKLKLSSTLGGSAVAVTVIDAVGSPLAGVPVYTYDDTAEEYIYAGDTTINADGKAILSVYSTGDVPVSLCVGTPGEIYYSVAGKLYPTEYVDVYSEELPAGYVYPVEITANEYIDCTVKAVAYAYTDYSGVNTVFTVPADIVIGAGMLLSGQSIVVKPVLSGTGAGRVTALDAYVCSYEESLALLSLSELSEDNWSPVTQSKGVTVSGKAYSVVFFRATLSDGTVRYCRTLALDTYPDAVQYGITESRDITGGIGHNNDKSTVSFTGGGNIYSVLVNGVAVPNELWSEEEMVDGVRTVSFPTDALRNAVLASEDYSALSFAPYKLTVTLVSRGESGAHTQSSDDITVAVYGTVYTDCEAQSYSVKGVKTHIPYGAAKTADGLQLPHSCELVITQGVISAPINWNVDSCTYDTELKAAQSFTVEGTVILPGGVTYNGESTIAVTAQLTVNADYTSVIPVLLVVPEKRDADMIPGGELEFNAYVFPSDATDTEIVWSSENEELVTVTPDGTATAVAVGECILKATNPATGLYAECTVYVSESGHTHRPVAATCTQPEYCRVCLEELSPALGHSQLAPATCTEPGVCERCDIELEEALGHDFSTEWTVDVPPTVGVEGAESRHCSRCDATTDSRSIPALIAVSGIELDKSVVELKAGSSFTLHATVSPADASDSTVTWRSGDESVATVTSAGIVTAVSSGNATIFAVTTDGGYTATCVVIVASTSIERIKGDIDGDGVITTDDARTALRTAVGLRILNSAEYKAADYNGDGTVTTDDARTILRKAVGLI